MLKKCLAVIFAVIRFVFDLAIFMLVMGLPFIGAFYIEVLAKKGYPYLVVCSLFILTLFSFPFALLHVIMWLDKTHSAVYEILRGAAGLESRVDKNEKSPCS